ncbi:MAG: hypothetical protein JWO58_2576 [Chitinophagaceae bacterium]|nr:hypothetical protein [Chitinophagaceae bacterium]
MKKTFTLLATLTLAFFTIASTIAQEVYIPDANFRTYLNSNYPSCMDGNNLITNAPGLASATSVIVDNSNITDLTGIEYFTALTFLSCSNNQLTSLPSLAATSINMMYCDHNQLTSVPALPATITRFTCSNNPIANLGTLPANLQYLYASTCDLASLPTLPSGLIYIDCRDNNIASLPTLPNTLCDLIASGNSITCIPNLPTGCTLSSDVGTTLCTATAISNPSSGEGLNVYPNPFAQSMQLQLADSYTGTYAISLYDMSGRVCEVRQNVRAGENIEMGLSLTSGFYFIEVKGEMKKERIKVIKQ